MIAKKTVLRKQRRNKLEIYFDVLRAINDESSTEGGTKPTRVQYRSNMSYDKFSKYLIELEDKKLINKSPLSLTNKGQNFMLDYDKINDFVIKLGLGYLTKSKEMIE